MSETLPLPPPPTDQATYWNTTGGETWVELQEVVDRMLEPIGAALIDRAFPGQGARVLDIGCGAGATTLAMAARLGADGSCLGVDISAPLVVAAQARAARERVGNARFLCADAQTAPLEPGGFDAVISRFGVMFFEDPDAAFANIRRALKPGGRLTCVAWRSPMENPMFSAPALAARPFLPAAPPPDPNAPGQFAFADPTRVTGILERTGWRAVGIEKLDIPQAIPDGDLMLMLRRMAPVGAAMQSLDPTTQTHIQTAVLTALEPFMVGETAHFTAACWLITARA
jgi:SAM-dependent methyltransferase